MCKDGMTLYDYTKNEITTDTQASCEEAAQAFKKLIDFLARCSATNSPCAFAASSGPVVSVGRPGFVTASLEEQ
jgi:hypothetical protein